jgi:phosphomevalonate kinase
VAVSAFSAPGKLFLAGEYSVLWGGVALVAAVGPRTSCLARPRDDRTVEILLESSRLRGTATPAGVRWDEEPSREFLFTSRAIDLVYRLSGREGPGLSAAFEPSPVSPAASGAQKLGMGSSARATVLAVEAARQSVGLEGDRLLLALVAHSVAQGHRGSGADVAACQIGGLVKYRRYDVSSLSRAFERGRALTAMAQAAPVDCLQAQPTRFPLLYAFTGAQASTPTLVREVEQRRSEAFRAEFVLASDEALGVLASGLARGDFEEVRRASARLQNLLASLGVAQPEALTQLLALGATNGCAGKQSGAGGGDGCIFFCPDESHRAALREAFLARGFLSFAVDPDAGLRSELQSGDALSGWLA